MHRFFEKEALLPQNWKADIQSVVPLDKSEVSFSQNVARQFVCQSEIRAQKSALYQIQTAMTESRQWILLRATLRKQTTKTE